MAPDIQLSSSIKLCVTFLLTILAFSEANYRPRPPKLANITVYLQDVAEGAPNAAGIVVAGPQPPAFGSVIVTDNRVTQQLSNESLEVGRAQGVFVVDSKDGNNITAFITLTFDAGEFNGSTLEIQGQSSRLETVREYAIIGGTKKLRCAKGYVTLEPLIAVSACSYAAGRSILVFKYGCGF